MHGRVCGGILSFAGLLAAAACSSSPATATVPTVAPQLLTPGNGAQLANQSQPSRFVQNAAGQGDYTFEVASDVAFTTKVGPGRHRREQRPNQREARFCRRRDYYWRARAQAPAAPAPWRSVQVHDRRGGDPGAPLSAHQRKRLRGHARHQCEPIGIGRRVTWFKSPGLGVGSIIVSERTPKASTKRASFTTTCAARVLLSGERRRLTPTASRARRPGQVSRHCRRRRRKPANSWESSCGSSTAGAVGHATWATWQVRRCITSRGTSSQSPTRRCWRIFDHLIGASTQWSRRLDDTNGYPLPPSTCRLKGGVGLVRTLASRKKVLGNGTWEVVLRGE